MHSPALLRPKALAVALTAAFLFALLPARGARADEAPVSAADAARLFRDGVESEAYALWEKTLVHVYDDPDIQKGVVVKSMLNYLTGQGDAPVTGVSLALVRCREVPLPLDGMTLYRGAQYNLHGVIHSDSPITNVTVKITHKADTSSIYPMVGKVDIPSSENVVRYSLDDTEAAGFKPVNELVNFDQLKLGRHHIEITATNASQKDVSLFGADFTIENAANRYPLLQCNFSDNYYSALRFFNYDTSKFMFHYSMTQSADRSIFTGTEWRETYLVDTDTIFGRVHKDAIPYFEQALEYLESSYVRVESEERDSKVRKLVTLIGEECGTYVPRFQNNNRYLSHHSLGTCCDINYDYFPNQDVITNHDLIGDDVRNNLVYNGIQTDESGQQYYSFTYTGSYSGRVNKIPKTVINYLLYELAFYRAGFSWGYYYITSCDAMHFTLTDSDYSRHTSKTMGLRKVYEYYN